MIVNVTVFPTNLVSYPCVRFMFYNFAHSLSAEKVNHELLYTAVMYAEGVNAVLHSLCGLVAHSFIPLRRSSAWTRRF